MNIFITHHYSYWNAGDTAITFVLIKQLKKMFPQVKLALSSMDYKLTKKHIKSIPVVSSFFYESVFRYKKTYQRIIAIMYVFSSTFIWSLLYRFFGKDFSNIFTSNLRELMQMYKNTDVVVAQGGGYLLSKSRALENDMTLALHGWGVVIPKILGKKVILHNQSIGPVASLWHRIILKQILRIVDFCFVREQISYKFITKMGISKSKIYLTTDAAFAYSGMQKIQTQNYLNAIGINKKIPLICFTVKDCLQKQKQIKFETQISQTINTLEKKGNQIICVPHCTSLMKKDDDREVILRISKIIGNNKNVHFLFDQKNPAFLRALFKECAFVVATRMHSAIFSLSVGTPVIALAYESKHMGIMTNLSLQKWVIPIQKVTNILLLSKIKELELHLDEYKKKIKTEIINQKNDLSAQTYHLAKRLEI